VRLPSRRATAVLAAAMLALGVAVGAAIGPSPGASQASTGTIVGSVVVPYLNDLERAELATAATEMQTTASATPTHRRRRRRHAGSASTTAVTTTTTTATTTTSTSSSSAGSADAPITSVWLIELAGGTFKEALAQPSAAPEIDQKIIPTGTLLSGWSSLDATAFAGEAALLGRQATSEATASTLQTITEPLCPEGTTGAGCAPGTAGALTAADTFLEQTLAVITESPAFSAHGLIVVTFGSLGAGSSAGLPGGSQTATVTSQPPGGVLLISPFAHAGARPSTAFNPTSPRQSIEKLLQR
jgi:hypothetical protein